MDALPPPSSVPPPAAEPRPLGPLGPAQPGTNGPRRRRGLGAIGAAIIAFLAKLKAILLLLGNVKLLATGGTMLVSLVAYGSIWGFQFAAGFVVLLLIHETGHVIELKRHGIKASAPIFIPFLGAMIGARSLGDDALTEAKVGLAGPLLGSLGALGCVAIYHATGNDLWRALAYTGFFLNLFNLIPVLPLDGGRAMSAMSPVVWLIGYAGLIVLAIIDPNVLFVLILVIGGLETFKRIQRYRAGDRSYYKVPAIDRALVAAVYIALIALLAVGMHATNLPRQII